MDEVPAAFAEVDGPRAASIADRDQSDGGGSRVMAGFEVE
jgi:hypothetical protein